MDDAEIARIAGLTRLMADDSRLRRLIDRSQCNVIRSPVLTMGRSR